MDDLQFREATLEDHSRLLELEQNIIDSERPYDSNIRQGSVTYYDLQKLISDADSYLVVVESAGKIVGSGYAQKRSSKPCHSHDYHGYLGFIYLEPEYRGKALGQEILNALTGWGKKQGLRHFFLDVYSKNVAAISAYEKAGFNKGLVNMELIL